MLYDSHDVLYIILRMMAVKSTQAMAQLTLKGGLF